MSWSCSETALRFRASRPNLRSRHNHLIRLRAVALAAVPLLLANIPCRADWPLRTVELEV